MFNNRSNHKQPTVNIGQWYTTDRGALRVIGSTIQTISKKIYASFDSRQDAKAHLLTLNPRI